MSLSPGDRIGFYEILNHIGSGGMGEVYRARDSRLGREVAFKVLPAEFTADPDRLRRFEHEARSASMINHPNIVTVFDVGTAPSPIAECTPYIATELVVGETLRQKLWHGPVPVRDAVRIAGEIAEALAAANDRGIVHRDLKPENVMLAESGRVKVLDFGLAKTMPGDNGPSETHTALSTPGMILGTTGYLSPEQVRGEDVDARSDIFALGLVVHEMLSGLPAFRRATTVETLSAILRDDVEELPDLVPLGLRATVAHCLEKDRRQRFQNAHDLAFALRTLPLTRASGEVLESTGTTPRRRRRAPAAVIGASLLTLATVAILMRDGAAATPDPLSDLQLTPLAVEAAGEYGAVWSPDGRSLAYFRGTSSGEREILSRRRDAAVPTVLSRGHSQNAQHLFWAPDGSRLFFIDGSQGGLRSVGSAGGGVRNELSGALAADLSPDGRTLAVWRSDANAVGSALWIGPYGGELHPYSPSPIVHHTSGMPNTLRFAPDGTKLLLWVTGTTSALHIVPTTEGGSAKKVLSGRVSALDGASWLPDSRHVVLALNGSLWLGDTEGDALRRITNGTTNASQPNVSKEGRIIFTDGSTDHNVVELLLTGGGPRPVVSTSRYDGSAIWDGRKRRLAYVTRRSGEDEVWGRSGDSDEDAPLARGTDFPRGQPNSIRLLSFSPDGEWLLLIGVYRSPPAEWRLFVASSRGGAVRGISPEGSSIGEASWDPTGQFIVAGLTNSTSSLEVFSLANDSSRVVTLPKGTAVVGARWSPNGSWIAARQYGPPSQLAPVLLIRPDGGETRVLPAIGSRWFTWSADAQSLYAVVHNGNRSVLRQLNIHTAQVRDIATYDRRVNMTDNISAGTMLAWGPNGLLVTEQTSRADLWMMSGLNPAPKRSWRARLRNLDW